VLKVRGGGPIPGGESGKKSGLPIGKKEEKRKPFIRVGKQFAGADLDLGKKKKGVLFRGCCLWGGNRCRPKPSTKKRGGGTLASSEKRARFFDIKVPQNERGKVDDDRSRGGKLPFRCKRKEKRTPAS